MDRSIRLLILSVAFLSMLTLNCECLYCLFCPQCDYCETIDAPNNNNNNNNDDDGDTTPVFDFTFTRTDDIRPSGVSDKFSNYSGRPILVSFFPLTTTCDECRIYPYALEDMYLSYRHRNLAVIAIILANAQGGTPTIEDANAYISTYGNPTHVIGIDNANLTAFNTNLQFFIDNASDPSEIESSENPAVEFTPFNLFFSADRSIVVWIYHLHTSTQPPLTVDEIDAILQGAIEIILSSGQPALGEPNFDYHHLIQSPAVSITGRARPHFYLNSAENGVKKTQISDIDTE